MSTTHIKNVQCISEHSTVKSNSLPMHIICVLSTFEKGAGEQVIITPLTRVPPLSG